MFFFFSSRRRHTRYWRDWSSDVCSSDLMRKRIPTKGDPRYDGGVAAYAGGFYGPGYFEGYSEAFDLGKAKRWARETRCGVLLLRPYWNASLSGQGHVAILDRKSVV